MPHYYLCRHRDRSLEDEGPPHWRVPTYQAVASLDLTPLAESGRQTTPDGIGTGMVIVALDQRDGDVERSQDGVYLGNDLDDVVGGALLMRRMGLNFKGKGASTLRDAIVDLFFEHSTSPKDKNRWNAPMPVTRRGGGARYEITLGLELVLSVPVVSGGATYTESFNKANSTTLGPDLTWQEVTGNSGVTNNQAENYSTAIGRMKALSDCATDNNYAKFTSATPSGGSYYDAEMGAICRYHATAATDTGYLSWNDYDFGIQNHIAKVVAGARTTLADLNNGQGGSAGTVYEMRAVGSLISFYVNGSSALSVTDTAITTGTKGGFQLRHTTAANRTALDSFEMGDLSTPSAPARRRARR